MVLGLQGYYTLVQFGSVGMLGSAVSLSLIRELGPVLTAIMLAGRAGSSMAAEIGVMRISDQIDALDVMDINPWPIWSAPGWWPRCWPSPAHGHLRRHRHHRRLPHRRAHAAHQRRRLSVPHRQFCDHERRGRGASSNPWSSACWWPRSAAIRATPPTCGVTGGPLKPWATPPPRPWSSPACSSWWPTMC